MLERDVKKSLKEYLTKIGAYQFWPVPTGFGATTVDVLFCYSGKFYAIECKRPGVHKPTGAQKLVLDKVSQSGGWSWVENDPKLTLTRNMLGA